MFFDWSVYSGDSDTENVSLLLSIRSKQLILSAMDYLDKRSNWLDVDDMTWDDIDAAVAEAFQEIMLEIEPVGGTMARHGVHVTSSVAHTSNASVTSNLFFDVEREDTDEYHLVSTNPDRLTVPSGLDGLYEISCNARWSDNGNPLNNCNLDIVLNGTTIIASVMNQKGGFTTGINSLIQHVSCIHPLVAGDYVTVQYRHQSVNGVGITKNADYSPEFKMYRISD